MFKYRLHFGLLLLALASQTASQKTKANSRRQATDSQQFDVRGLSQPDTLNKLQFGIRSRLPSTANRGTTAGDDGVDRGGAGLRGDLEVDHLARGARRMGEMVACSETLVAVWRAIDRFAPSRITVLVQGETGTGKDLVARALHEFGTSPNGPFVVFNCCNLLEGLAESQLFGHVRGAFAGASEDSQGYLRAADGGTLFLDKVGELSLSVQGKLLRVLETLEAHPVGSFSSYRVSARIVAASSRDLRAMVEAGQFRADLLYRLSNATITLPPLRERMADLDPLIAHFVQHYSATLNKPIGAISAQALEALRRHRWPGNARELANLIEGAVMLSSGPRLDLDSFSGLELEDGGRGWSEPMRGGATLATNGQSAPEEEPRRPLTLKAIMRDALLTALAQTGGNRYRAAELLAVSRSTFYRMMARYDVQDTKAASKDADAA